ncbi:MAG: rhomboid family intramembrane serine protease [bacterium]
MPAKNNADGWDWVELLVRAGKLIGLNPVRTRWKLRSWRQQLSNRRRSLSTRAGYMTRKHRTCPSCRALNSMEETHCARCGEKLQSRPVEIAGRFLRHFNLGLSPETFLAIGFVAVYVVVVLNTGSGWFDLRSADLIRLGGNSVWSPAGDNLVREGLGVLQDRWYMLWTSVFLHGGIIHLGFNTYVLVYLSPLVRNVYSSRKLLAVFFACGIAGSLVSFLWQNFMVARPTVSIGASGAIMGLIGLVMVWGHRDGTEFGRSLRNSLIKWVLIILVFGFLVGADNPAHLGGLAAGGALAVLIPTNLNRPDTKAWRVLGTVSALLCAAAIIYITYLAFTIPPLMSGSG